MHGRLRGFEDQQSNNGADAAIARRNGRREGEAVKRVRTISVDDGQTKVVVSVKMESRGLMRDELQTMSDVIASGVMNKLANTRYLHAYLSDVKVK